MTLEPEERVLEAPETTLRARTPSVGVLISRKIIATAIFDGERFIWRSEPTCPS
jgi:hypothetical protein